MTSLSSIPSIAQKWAGASQTVVNAIQNASARTGVSFDYLMDKAKQESSFDSDAKAKTSSASGLFQFIESTWMNAVKTYGDKFGLGDLASKISVDGSGTAHVADDATKKQILDLRNDPTVSSNLVAAMTKDNASYLQNSLGGKVGETDLYMAHFLGLGGADKFLKAKQANPLAAAADLFPAAAKANKNVFYNADGSQRSLDQVYGFFAQKMGEGNGTTKGVVTGTMTAQAAQPAIKSVAANNFTVNLPNIDAMNASTDSLFSSRHLIDAMLSGVASMNDNAAKEHRLSGNLLSPYTSFVLAHMKTPDEKSDAKSAKKDDKTDAFMA
jgi:hypothetical protein